MVAQRPTRGKAVTVFVLGLTLGLTAACGNGETTETAETTESEEAEATEPGVEAETERSLIVSIAKTLDNPAFAVAKAGAEARIEELGGSIDLEWVAPVGADPAKQVELIEGYVQRGVDGLLIDSLGPSVCAAIDAAVDAGIPVVTWDSDCAESKRMTYVGSDNYEGGYRAGELYVEAVEGAGPQRIAILTGVLGAPNLQERDAGFEAALTDAGLDFTITQTVAGNDDVSKSVDAVEAALRGDPTINGFFFDGPWPLLVDASNLPTMIDMVERGELTIVGFDTLEAQLQYVEDGTVIGLVGQKYFGWGYQGIQVLNEHIRNGAVFPSIANTGLDVVTLDGGDGIYSVEEMRTAWQNQDFAEVPLEPSS